MKNIFKLGILAMVLATGLTSCENEDPIGSRVTVYPEMTLNGEAVVVLTEGDSFTDQGAVSLIGEDEVEVTTTGNVDPTTPGVYDLYYSSANEDGFSAQLRRTIIVLSAEPSTINLEGTFYRNGNANNIVKIADRVYTSDNAGGLGIADAKNFIKFTFYNIDDERIYAPYQTNTSESGISVETNIGTIVSENNFTWVLYASATYGTAVRNFTR
ncbi:immunoglobulin-like domain-containing protein [Flavobacterium psychrotrophum]|uniref:immunoglobulin-like domain-containing protein n=1 Tax=Flavobacterium psychrotrophum TaxID=2294119 RepID=UPI000E31FA4A|nr:immunoglobulin-like domain-containing protein [Flavobacterium psychrotrophum]